MPRRPNIVLITTDQQRGDCLGRAGHPVVETPYLDELAEQGTMFSRAYTACPSCIAARAAILTGMDQWNHGRLDYAGYDSLEFPTTLPAELAKAGYHTQAVGKMHVFPQRKLYGFHNTILDESGRRYDGFISDYHLWFEKQKHSIYSEIGYRDHSIDWNSWMARPSHLPEHLHPTYWTASEGINFIRRKDPTKPFFLFLSFARPHSPYDPPQVYYDMYAHRSDIPMPVIGDWAAPYDRKVDDVNAAFSHRRDVEVRRARAAYYGSITFIDHQIGRFLYEYREADPAGFQNTLFIFTSDHGDMLGDHYHWRKTYAYEGSAHIPFIVSYPQSWGMPQGQIVDSVVELRDIMPTILEAAGVPIPESVDGESVLRLCRGDRSGWRRYIQGEHSTSYTHEAAMQYITDGREKYIWFHRTGHHQLFDLTRDPMECHDLSKDPTAQERIEYWSRQLAEINERRGDPRGKNGRLIPQPDGVMSLSPNYWKWKQRADELEHR